MLNIIDPQFNTAEKILFFGAGRNCAMFLEGLKENMTIVALIDNDTKKHNTKINNIDVLSINDALSLYPSIKIVVNSELFYHDIANQLSGKGLKEDIDFCSILKFQASWYWHNKKQLVLFQTNSAITMKCTLNCRKCSMLIPYHKQPEHYPFDILKKDYDLFFSFVNKVRYFHILGGEPLMHPELLKILKYLIENYRNKVNRFRITTNGTVAPKKELLDFLSDHQIYVIISDYSNVVNYEHKLNKTIKLLTDYSISFEVASEIKWNDYGFPEAPKKYDDSYLKQHMAYCSTQCKGLNDGKLYYCHTVWSAEKAGIFKSKSSDVLDLQSLNSNKESDKLTLLKYYLGIFGDGSLSLCKYCGGQSFDNEMFVNAGEQLQKKEL